VTLFVHDTQRLLHFLGASSQIHNLIHRKRFACVSLE
jgi:hypothetical protein